MKSDQNRLKSDQNHDLIRFYLEVWSDLIRLFIFLNVFHFFLFFPSPKNEIWSKQVKPDQYHVFFCKLFFPLFLQKVSFHLGKRQPFNVSKLFFHCLAIKNISAWKKQFGIIDLKKKQIKHLKSRIFEICSMEIYLHYCFSKKHSRATAKFYSSNYWPKTSFCNGPWDKGPKKNFAIQKKRRKDRLRPHPRASPMGNRSGGQGWWKDSLLHSPAFAVLPNGPH